MSQRWVGFMPPPDEPMGRPALVFTRGRLPCQLALGLSWRLCLGAEHHPCLTIPAVQEYHHYAMYVLFSRTGTVHQPTAQHAVLVQGTGMTYPGKPMPAIARVRLASVDRESRGLAASGPLSDYPELYQAA